MHGVDDEPENARLLDEAEGDSAPCQEDENGIELQPLRESADEEDSSKLLSRDGLNTPPSENSAKDEFVWTKAEERRVLLKLDSMIMPLLIIAFFALQLDRGNIGNALTDFFLDDVDITQTQFNFGQQLLALGIVLWEIPSNFVLYRVGPSIWLSCQIVAWGLVATLQSAQHGVGAFWSTRFLLGSFESGFIPASLYTISRFYKRDETSKRFAWFFIGNHFASAVSGVLAYGILHMRGVFGLAGWQWLFIVEGVFTMSIGVLFIIFFPKSVSKPSSLGGIRYFSEKETRILMERVVRDDPSKGHSRSNITKAEIRSTFTNWRLIPHVIATVAGLSAGPPLMAYGPELVIGWGYGRLRSNAMASIGPSIGVVLGIIWGMLADRFGMRGPVALSGLFGWWLFLLVGRLLVYSPNGTARFIAFTTAVAFQGTWHPVNGSWMALNAPTAGERSITMAILIMSANSAGIVGSQLFQESDAPLYPVGWTLIVVLTSLALVAMIVANYQYWYLNRRLERKGFVKQFHP